MTEQKDDHPFRGCQPRDVLADAVIDTADIEDDRLWAPLAAGVWSRPLHLNVSLGYYVHLFKSRRSGVLQRHRHSGPVHAYVIKGSWYYPEHDWVAREGCYVFEPPGVTHTLTVPDDCDEMITLFTVFGMLVYVDEHGQPLAVDDVFERLRRYREHFRSVGLGADYADRFIR